MDTRSIHLPSETYDAFSVQVIEFGSSLLGVDVMYILSNRTTTTLSHPHTRRSLIGLGTVLHEAAVAKVFTS